MKYRGIVLFGVLAALILLAGPARSVFTDVAHSENNEISSGEFDIALSRDGSRFYNDLRLFEFSDLKPGDERTFTFYVKNRGDVDVSRLTMVFHMSDLEDGPLSPAEKPVDNTTEVGELSRYLIIRELKVYLGNESWEISSVSGKSLRDVSGAEIGLISRPLREGEVLRVTVRVEFSEDAGNDCQTDRANIDITLNAEQ